MTETKVNKMNDTNRHRLTDCQKQIEPMMAELRDILASAEQQVNSTVEHKESQAADICLASRSAYFDFYTWVVLHGTIDAPAQKELDQLFQRSLAVIEPGRFKISVASRYKDFKRKCDSVANNSMSSEYADSV